MLIPSTVQMRPLPSEVIVRRRYTHRPSNHPSHRLSTKRCYPIHRFCAPADPKPVFIA